MAKYRLSKIGNDRDIPCAYICKEGYGILFPLLLMSEAREIVNFMNSEDDSFRSELAKKDEEIKRLQNIISELTEVAKL